MVTELLQKYIWLVQTFIRAGERGLSLGEISDRWESRFDSEYSRRTFNNHREAIEDVFGITIECNRSTNRLGNSHTILCGFFFIHRYGKGSSGII